MHKVIHTSHPLAVHSVTYFSKRYRKWIIYLSSTRSISVVHALTIIFWYFKWYENIEITLQKKLRYWFHIIFFGAVYNKEGIFKIQEYMQECLLNIWILIELWILIKNGVKLFFNTQIFKYVQKYITNTNIRKLLFST